MESDELSRRKLNHAPYFSNVVINPFWLRQSAAILAEPRAKSVHIDRIIFRVR